MDTRRLEMKSFIRLSVKYLDSTLAISSSIVSKPPLSTASLQAKGGITLKPLTSGVKLNGFLPSRLSIRLSLHQGCFLSWSAVKQDLIGEELLINNT